jgi:hypothetical protein
MINCFNKENYTWYDNYTNTSVGVEIFDISLPLHIDKNYKLSNIFIGALIYS